MREWPNLKIETCLAMRLKGAAPRWSIWRSRVTLDLPQCGMNLSHLRQFFPLRWTIYMRLSLNVAERRGKYLGIKRTEFQPDCDIQDCGQ